MIVDVRDGYKPLFKLIGGTRDIDILVLNAGIMRFDEQEHWSHIYYTNFHCNWEILLHARELVTQGGCIILNASSCGVLGDAEVPYYAAQKAALINLTKSFAKILLPERIRVNCFSCGFFQTNLCGGPTPQELIDTIPMKREAHPSEILPIIDALVYCTYITGQNIIVDGGLSLGTGA